MNLMTNISRIIWKDEGRDSTGRSFGPAYAEDKAGNFLFSYDVFVRPSQVCRQDDLWRGRRFSALGFVTGSDRDGVRRLWRS